MMREWIDIIQEASIRKPVDLYHKSKQELEEGTVLEPRGNFNVADSIEQLLEECRPSNMPSRKSVVYMMSSLNDFGNFGTGIHGFIYRVTPQGKLFRHDAINIGILQKAFRNKHIDHPLRVMSEVDWDDEQRCREIALDYWLGNRNSSGKRPLWEYTAPNAVVGKLVKI